MYQPDVIIAYPKKIEPLVQESIRISSIHRHYYTLPFPGNGHQNDYMEGLISIFKGQ